MSWVEGGQRGRPSSCPATDRSRLRHGEGLLRRRRRHLLLSTPVPPPPRREGNVPPPERASNPDSLCPPGRASRWCSQARTRHIFLLGPSPIHRACPGEEEPRGSPQLIGPKSAPHDAVFDSLMTSQHSITIAAPHRCADQKARSGLPLPGGSRARRDPGGAEYGGGGASSEVGAVLLIRPRHGERVQQCTVQNVVPGSAAMRYLPTSSPHCPRWSCPCHSPQPHSLGV
jgi:hypothetical protein